ncbi:hypothetical protein ABMA10_07735 [Plantibacter sp. RU18]
MCGVAGQDPAGGQERTTRKYVVQNPARTRTVMIHRASEGRLPAELVS